MKIAGPDAKLTAAEKRRVKRSIQKAQRDGKIPRDAVQTIPYRELFPDGLMQVNDKLYTKTLRFSDINYELAQPEDKEQTFDGLCDFYNALDSSMWAQMNFINLRANLIDYRKSVTVTGQGDNCDDMRRELETILQAQLAKGNNGLLKRKYFTFGIEADSGQAARPRVERIEADLRNHLKNMGVRSEPLSGYDRLEVLHGIFHPDGREKLRFNWDAVASTGLTTKPFIAPSSFDFRGGRTFKIGGMWGAASFLQIGASQLNDRVLSDFLNLDCSQIVTIHIKAVNQQEAIKTIKRKLTDIEKTKIEEQKKAVRSGYDMDVLPPDLITYAGEAQTLLNSLQSRDERMFLATVLIVNLAPTRGQLENDVFQAASVAQKHNCALKRLDWQQEQGLMSSLPLGLNQIEIQRGLTTSSLAIFVPFTTEELFMDGEALYYGINALSSNLIMADRKRLKNPNGLFLGVPGSGKSFSAKREIANAFLTTKDDIIITDPEAEYAPLVNRLGGQVVQLSPVSTQYVNPMDINPDYSDEENPLTLKSDFILSLCELIVASKDGLQPVEKTIIDRCTRLVYRDYLAAPRPEKMPVLGDLYNLLLKQEEPEAKRLATALEIYVTGSLNVFNHRTNVDLENRLVCYDIKQLGKGLKKIAMLVLQDQVWNRVTVNRAAHKTTWFYCDEFHLLLKDEQTAAYSVEIWKRFRKWGGIPSALTQNVKDLLSSREIENIFENSDFIYMLSQAAGDRQILARQLGISPTQLSYVTHSNAGEGLLFYGNTIIPFVDHFPKDTELYRIMTTKPEEQTENNE
ncbi:conjugal transfer protein TraE [Lachnoclostridium pacaense]|uniref:VirB4-like conjugal transfer ATPase, CD1110 family n=1 Tax=Enterocloster hominis (ex Hitch et al. 2024) TaxID=1917870 RepID=UPI001D10C463|nr:conjugal transfer protein TraE [Lachnoclostridium pacaense]MCC2818969.1 conjugal transfer protein TraE [Lachnoclostridium pacaense]